MSDVAKELFKDATRDEVLAEDARLRQLSREQVLQLSPQLRLRWFYLLQLGHAELDRVSTDLLELLEPDNEVRIISIIGMTGIGKTTLATTLMHTLIKRLTGASTPEQVPVIYVRAPANGDKSLSWRVLYKRILEAGGELMVERKRAAIVTEGEFRLAAPGKIALAELREFIETMVKNRRVRVLVVDEALHLLRFDDYGAIMDTLKSLADIHDLKLLLIGTYQIAPLMTEYGQVARRSEIVHYRRYESGQWFYEELPVDYPKGPRAPSHAEFEFRKQVAKLQSRWPCDETPNLLNIAEHLTKVSLGSIGLLKTTLLRMASIQMTRKGERLTTSMLKKGPMSRKSLATIEAETKRGEEALKGACYGDALIEGAEEMRKLMAAMTEPVHV